MHTLLALSIALPVFAQTGELPAPQKPEPIPTSARPAVEKCEKAIGEAKKIYDAICTKARAQAIKDLEAALKAETQKGNLNGAVAIKDKLDEYKNAQELAKPDAVPRTDTIIVEVFIDGDSKLHITPTGIYWTAGTVAKPGATNVNGNLWTPVWNNKESEPYAMTIVVLNFNVEVVHCSVERGQKVKESRDPVTIKLVDQEQVVSIPDSQPGSRWYTLRLFRK